MERHRTIDTTLRERRDILDLLERLKKESITVDEMEEIGTRLKKAGRRALSPLVRRLWQERSGDLISRYTYLLDFFEDEPWLDQLITITISRTDLEDEARAVLLSALAGYGVDVSAPPFARILDETGGPLRVTLPRLLDKGEKGVMMFMEDFVAYDVEAQRAIVRELGRVDDHRVVEIFAVLLGFDEPETLREVLETLGRIRTPEAAALLRRFVAGAPEEQRSLAERSLRRLSFLGLGPEPVAAEGPLLPFHAAYASPVDAAGLSCVMVARWRGEERLDTLFMELHESEGMREAWGWSGITPEEYGKILAENRVEEALVAVEPAHGAELVRDAIHRSVAAGFYLPPEFYVRQRIFAGVDLTPALYVPSFAGKDLEQFALPWRMAGTEELLQDWFYDGWFVFTGRTRLLAEELERQGDDPFGRQDEAGIDRFLERWCREQVVPRMDRLVRRLFLTADLLARSGREELLVEQTLAAAVTLSRGTVAPHRHPFVRRWLVDLIMMVREARAEGYEFPSPDHDDDDGDELE
ncbi:HEAT repeat domain-containing protein [Geobacter pickeringii]|uniref:HEAT repeat domain-containing protein n=1 Tax=Geobacter pickeringii TaxID=345632 RepID=A0A0B5BBN6_9BACT|nr:HEAT repeat domain-containing protein [Geobacter pickeringii]AJE01975.1 hypothetical protein GPICK_00030 [Geobacter pickeringii]